MILRLLFGCVLAVTGFGILPLVAQDLPLPPALPEEGETKQAEWRSPDLRLTDALDNVLRRVEIEFFEVLPNAQVSSKPFATITTDALGGLDLPALPDQRDIALRVRLQDYEAATITRLTFEEAGELKRQSSRPVYRKLRLPVVPPKSKFATRAVHGVVLDEAGRPVVGAEVFCRSLTYERKRKGQWPGYEKGIDPLSSVLTGRTGRFRLYLPVFRREEPLPADLELPGDVVSLPIGPPYGVRRKPLPGNCEYDLLVRVPGDLTLCPVKVKRPNSSDVVIRLRRTTRKYRLELQSLSGKVLTEQAELSRVTLRYQPPGAKSSLVLIENEWIEVDQRIVLNGGPLHPGRYWASYEIPYRQSYNWEIREIDEKSPQTIRFRTPPPVLFTGRVVDGTNGEPLAGIFVGGYNSRADRNSLASLSADEWDAAELLSAEPSIDAKALQPFLRVYGFKKFVRTDEQGRFQLVQQPDNRFYGVIAVARDKLQISTRVYHGDLFTKIPDLALFPAARIRLQYEGDSSELPVGWSVESGDQPQWLSTMRKQATSINGRQIGVRYRLRPNKSQWLQVPAGLRLRLVGRTSPRFALYRFPGPNGFADSVYLLDKTIDRLDAGEERDLGKVPLEPTLAVRVKVVGPQGQPVVGADVRCLHSSGFDTMWTLAHSTDGLGIAWFHVPRNSSVTFAAMSSFFKTREEFEQVIKVKTEAKPPAQPFKIQLTAEQLRIVKLQ